ncbi:hypothetical protein Q7P37_006416 [Cladosporium fusiforme]
MAAYRPPGRSGRSGRTQADNDIFEGLPVKQWSAAPSRISLAPPPTEAEIEKAHDKWADPAMPENFQLLLPHTQQLLRIARSGRYGTKRKNPPDAEPDTDEFNAREEEGLAEELASKPVHNEEKGFVARKWRQVPESALVPEHLHWEFLAKRRKGLPSFYHGGPTEISTSGIPQIAKRKTRVQRVLDPATGQSVIYEVLALEGQVLENELPAESQMQATRLEPGTTVEGLGTADDEGLINLVPANPVAPSRRNRPPQKKKGGPGRGKKRVTFTNPDGSTYTTIVPNATKIVPQPGQTVKHVAKGEDAGKDVSMEEAARQPNENGEQVEGDEDDDDEGEEGDDDEDDDDREDGEIQEMDAELATTPAKKPSAETPVVDSTPRAEEPTPKEPTPREPTPREPTPKAPTPKEPTPTESAPPLESTQDQTPVNQPQPDIDVEMQDRPAEEAEPVPEAQEEAPAEVPAGSGEVDGPRSPEKPQQDVEVEMQDRPGDDPEPLAETQPELAEVEVTEPKSPEKTQEAEAPQQPEETTATISEAAADAPALSEPVQGEEIPSERAPSEPAPIEPTPSEHAPVSAPHAQEPVQEVAPEPSAPQVEDEQAAEATAEATTKTPEPQEQEVVQERQTDEVVSEQQSVEAAPAADEAPNAEETQTTDGDVAPQPQVAELTSDKKEEEPAKTGEESEEDLLGSLEKSLES